MHGNAQPACRDPRLARVVWSRASARARGDRACGLARVARGCVELRTAIGSMDNRASCCAPAVHRAGDTYSRATFNAAAASCSLRGTHQVATCFALWAIKLSNGLSATCRHYWMTPMHPMCRARHGRQLSRLALGQARWRSATHWRHPRDVLSSGAEPFPVRAGHVCTLRGRGTLERASAARGVRFGARQQSCMGRAMAASICTRPSRAVARPRCRPGWTAIAVCCSASWCALQPCSCVSSPAQTWTT